MDPAVLNQKLKVLWLGCGTEDKTVSFSFDQELLGHADGEERQARFQSVRRRA